MLYGGIDPGLKGGICFLTQEGRLHGFYEMPVKEREISATRIRNLIAELNQESRVYIEHSQAIPGASSGSSFTFGRGFGCVCAVLELSAIPYTLVKPQAWQKVMHQGADKSLKAKERSAQVFRRLMATMDMEHDGIIDAYLIAEYGRRQLVR